MGRYPMTAHELAREVARRWLGAVELLPVEALPGRGDQSPAGGHQGDQQSASNPPEDGAGAPSTVSACNVATTLVTSSPFV